MSKEPGNDLKDAASELQVLMDDFMWDGSEHNFPRVGEILRDYPQVCDEVNACSILFSHLNKIPGLPTETKNMMRLKGLVIQYENAREKEKLNKEVCDLLQQSPNLVENESVCSYLFPHLEHLVDLPKPISEKIRSKFPLHDAVKQRVPIDILQKLVPAHSLTKKVGAKRETPLHYAANDYHDRVVFELLASPEAVRSVDSNGNLPLHTYCGEWSRYGQESRYDDLDVNLVTFLVGLYPESLGKLGYDGYSPLHIACYGASQEDLPVIRFLLNGNNSGVSSSNGNDTPLHVACSWYSRASPEVIRFLMQSMPDSVRTLSGFGCTPLLDLCKDLYLEDLEYLQLFRELVEAYPESLSMVNRPCLETPLHLLCANASSEEIPLFQFMLDACPEVRTKKNHKGYTPLHCVCVPSGLTDPDVIHFLAEQCPELISPQQDSGDTPLHVLLSVGHTYKYFRSSHDTYVPFMEALQVTKEAVKAKDSIGQTALHLLSQRGMPSQDFEFLLSKYPAAACENDDQGQIPLHLAVQASSREKPDDQATMFTETLECLLQAFPGGVLTKDTNGKTPLELACETGLHVSLIYQLVSVNPIVVMGLEGGRRVEETASRKRKRVA